MILNCINPKGKFILSPKVKRQGPLFKVSFERQVLDIHEKGCPVTHENVPDIYQKYKSNDLTYL